MEHKCKKSYFLFIALAALIYLSSPQLLSQAAPPAERSNEEQYKLNFKEADEHLGKFEFEASLKSCEAALRNKPDDFLIQGDDVP